MSLLGLDIGSSSCKGAVFTHGGKILAQDTKEYSTYSPQPAMVEMKGEIFWEAAAAVIRQLASRVTKDPIEAMAISSHGETFIPVDKTGKPVGPAIMNTDNRGIEEAQWCEQVLGKEKIYGITGLPVHPMYAMPKILWLKKHKPEIFNAAGRFASVTDFILQQLGLPPYIDYSLASRVMAFDIKQRKWSDEILKVVDLKPERLSIPLASGRKAGSLNRTMAGILGLREGIIIALGGHDQPCGALGAGIIGPGDVFDSAGTYECLAAASDTPSNSPKALEANLNTYCHVVPDKYVTLAFFPAGIALQWFCSQFCSEEITEAKRAGVGIYDILNSRVPEGPTGICITPHLIGSGNPYLDAHATGVIVGLTPTVTKYHLYKAVFEGIACELGINVRVLEEAIGEFEVIRISGGGTKADFAVQLRADLTGKRIETLRSQEAVCQGAAILAGIASGVYKNAADAVERVVKFDRRYIPDAEHAGKYEIQRKRYDLLYPSLTSIWSA